MVEDIRSVSIFYFLALFDADAYCLEAALIAVAGVMEAHALHGVTDAGGTETLTVMQVYLLQYGGGRHEFAELAVVWLAEEHAHELHFEVGGFEVTVVLFEEVVFFVIENVPVTGADKVEGLRVHPFVGKGVFKRGRDAVDEKGYPAAVSGIVGEEVPVAQNEA